MRVVPALTNNGLQIRAEKCCEPKSTDYHYAYPGENSSKKRITWIHRTVGKQYYTHVHKQCRGRV